MEYFDPYLQNYRRVETFESIREENIINIIKYWFDSHYEDPAMRCPYYEGEYHSIYGSFVWPEEPIREEFEEIVDEEILEKF